MSLNKRYHLLLKQHQLLFGQISSEVLIIAFSQILSDLLLLPPSQPLHENSEKSQEVNQRSAPSWQHSEIKSSLVVNLPNFLQAVTDPGVGASTGRQLPLVLNLRTICLYLTTSSWSLGNVRVWIGCRCSYLST